MCNRSSLIVVFLAGSAGLALLMGGSSVSSKIPPPPVGSASCDFEVNSIDAALVLQFAARLIDFVCDSDVNLDGDTDSLDAVIILQIDAGLCCPRLRARVTTNVPLGPHYAIGPRYAEPVVMSFSVTNEGDIPVTRRYTNGQHYEFQIWSGGEVVWRWSTGRSFTEAIELQTLEPGQTVTYTEVWDQVDEQGEQVPLGFYLLIATDLGCSLLPPSRCSDGPLPLDASSGIPIPDLPWPVDCGNQDVAARVIVGDERQTLLAGEDEWLALSIRNCTDQPLTHTYSTFHIYDFALLNDKGERVWLWSANRPFRDFEYERTIPPGVTYGYRAYTFGLHFLGQVGTGQFEIIGFDSTCDPDALEQCDIMARAPLEIVPETP